MSGEFGHITRCLDLRDQEVAEALAGRETTKALLARLEAVSAPNSGAAKVLIVFARLATTACDWIDGDLCVELIGDGQSTVIEAATQLGGGLRERVLPPTRLRAPFVEFARAIERVPHMVAPLTVRARSSHRVSLAASDVVRRTTAPPPPIAISGESLYVHPASPGMPREMDESPEPPEPPASSDVSPGDSPDALPNDLDSGWDE